MKKLQVILSVFIISYFALNPTRAQAEIPPKAKAFLVMCAYGTVGGALLGFASLAFQNNTRAIAQGASLGLYGGMAFGGYVIASYQKPGSVEEIQDPYPQQEPPPGFGPPGELPPEDGGGFFGVELRVNEINNNYASHFESKKGTINSPPIYVPILHMSF